MRTHFLILILEIIISGCSTNKKTQGANQVRYFAELDLMQLDFKGPLKNPKSLPYIKVSEESNGKLRGDFYFKSHKRPLKTGYVTSSPGYRILTTGTFDGKVYTKDTLISDGHKMVEFRYEHFNSNKITYSKIFYYEMVKADSIDCRFYWLNNSTGLKIIRPSTNLDLEKLAKDAIYAERYFVTSMPGKFSIQVIDSDRQPLGFVATNSTSYTLYWTLFLHNPWISIQRN